MMGMSSQYASNKRCTQERSPKLLKDFLHENNHTPSLPTCSSSSGFNSYPTLHRSRSRSRAAADAAISSFHKLLNAVSSFHYRSSSSSSSPPLTLPRSFSQKLLDRLSVKKMRRGGDKSSSKGLVKSKVKVRDILRWRSFRDLDEPKLPGFAQCDYSDAVVLDHVRTNPLITTTATHSESGGSNSDGSGSGSSWGEIDFSFTAAELPRWPGNSGEEGKKWENTDDVLVTVPHVGPKEDNQSMGSEEDKEQHSPVSVLDSPFRDQEVSDEEFVSSFDKSLASMERTKQSLLERIQWFESLAGVADQDDKTESVEGIEEDNAMEAKTGVFLSRAMRTLGEDIEGMETQGKWMKFEDEQKDVGVELEVQVLSELVDEVLIDLYG